MKKRSIHSFQNAFFVSLILTILFLIQPLSLRSDETKFAIYNLGYDLARPTSQGLRDNEALYANAEIMGNIQKYLNSALETAQKLGLVTDSLENFKRGCENFTRAQYMNQGRLVLDEYQ